jgi:hypothetical protein
MATETDPYTFYVPVHVYRGSDGIEVGYEDIMAPKIEEVVNPLDDFDFVMSPRNFEQGVKSISYTPQGMYKIEMNRPVNVELQQHVNDIINQNQYKKWDRKVGMVSRYETTDDPDDTLQAGYDTSSIVWPDGLHPLTHVSQTHIFKIKPDVRNSDGFLQTITPEVAQNLRDNIDPAHDFWIDSNEIVDTSFDGEQYTVYMKNEITPADRKGIEQDIEAGKFMGGERGVWDVPEPDGMTDESFVADWQASDITWPPGIDDPVDEGYPDQDDYGDDN